MTRVLLVGCGKMGGAMLRGWLDRGLDPADAFVIEPSDAARTECDGRVASAANLDAMPSGFLPDIVVLAVKPQVMADVLPPFGCFAKRATFLSIAAGKSLAFFREVFGAEAAVVRAMPNTPAAVRRGITVACPSPTVGDAARRACHDLLAAVGEVAWTEDEGLMDAVTAVSGSGPAYVFLLAETMAAAGIAAGLPPDLAAQLARATVVGSGELLHCSSAPVAELRKNVTSPGGTTAAALGVLMADDGLEPLMTRAVAAATRRGRELAG